VVEQRPFKPKVVGSIPTAPTNILLTLLWLEKPEGGRGCMKSTFSRSPGHLRWNHQTNHLAVSFSNSDMSAAEDEACLEDSSRLAQSVRKSTSNLLYLRLRFFPPPESEMYLIAQGMEGSYAGAHPGQLGASLRHAMAR
jgi:hypothetical protein